MQLEDFSPAFGVLLVVALFFLFYCIDMMRNATVKRSERLNATSLATDVMRNATVERFVLEMAKEKSIRFTPDQLIGFTCNYATRLGAGGFGTVYRGRLPNGLAVAVKVLHPGLDTRTSEEQFMAEMGTIGRTHHINLVRLYGFCFDGNATRALVYEFMEHGSLDDYLSCGVSMTTVYPGYAAPEVWMKLRITEKCDVYSFGMLLLKIVERGSSFNAQDATSDSERSQPWFPMVAWTRYEAGGLMELVLPTDVDDSRSSSRELVERMCKVALWCVQQRPPARPSMSAVVKMLKARWRSVHRPTHSSI